MDDESTRLNNTLTGLINELGEEQLLELNRLIVERIKAIRAQRKASSMSSFSVGDDVVFLDKQGEQVSATVLRLNKKTMSLVTDEGERWNVAPELCELARPAAGDLFDSREDKREFADNVTELPVANTARSAATPRWSGGIAELPAFVEDSGRSYRPLAVLWLDERGLVIGTNLSSPDDDINQLALDCLQRAMVQPNIGEPQRPAHITVNDATLATFLGAQLDGIEVVHGDTPALQEAFDGISGAMGAGDVEPAYLDTGLSTARIAAFFEAAAALYRSAPWQTVPHDACLVGVTIEALGVHNAVLSVIGQMEQSYGLSLFVDMPDYMRYQIAADAMRTGGEPDIPPHCVLSFEAGAQVSDVIRREVAEHGWPVADAHGYPVFFNPDRDNLLRPMDRNDIAVFEALCRALPTVLEHPETLIHGWDDVKDFETRVKVESLGETVTVKLFAPASFSAAYKTQGPGDYLMVDLALLAHTAAEPSFEANQELCDELLAEFLISPEDQNGEDEVSILKPLLELAFLYQSATIATLQAGALEELLFEIIPRKVMVPPSSAGTIIAECSQFYHFLKRRYGLIQADACLQMLGAGATERLAEALSDTGGFGPGKAALAEGMAPSIPGLHLPPGFDTSGFGSAFDGPTGHAPSGKPADPRSKKKKRKAARKARKKNR